MNIRHIGLYTGWVLLGLMALSACQNDQAVRRVAPAVPTLPEIAQLPGAAWVMPAGTGWVQEGDRIAFTLPEGYRMHYYDETGALANTILAKSTGFAVPVRPAGTVPPLSWISPPNPW